MNRVIIIFLMLGLSQTTWAEIPLTKLYGLREATVLEQLINQEKNTANTPEEQKRLGIAWHNLAVLEQSGAAQKSYDILKPLAKTLPKDYEVLAYLGSAQTMVARDSWNPVSKISDVNKGIAQLDQAVSKAEDNYVIRLVRINNSMALPVFLGRGGKVKPDLEYLLNLYKHVEAPIEDRAEVYFKMGQILVKEDKNEEAKTYFKQAIVTAPNSEFAKQAQEALND